MWQMEMNEEEASRYVNSEVRSIAGSVFNSKCLILGKIHTN